jgi:hypothetical protein
VEVINISQSRINHIKYKQSKGPQLFFKLTFKDRLITREMLHRDILNSPHMIVLCEQHIIEDIPHFSCTLPLQQIWGGGGGIDLNIDDNLTHFSILESLAVHISRSFFHGAYDQLKTT